MAGAADMGFGGEVLVVVAQAGQPRRAVGQMAGDGDACRLQVGDEAVVGGGLGAVLPDPLGGVLEPVTVFQALQQPVRGVFVAVELGE